MTKLYNYLVMAPESPWKTYRGYDRAILSDGVHDFLTRHTRMLDERPGLGLMLGYPGGKDRDMIAWRDGFTGIRSDQIVKAAADPRGAQILQDIMEFAPKNTILYVGSYPNAKPLAGYGLPSFRYLGFWFAFDALSSQTDRSQFLTSACMCFEAGINCWTESNDARRLTGNMPVLASATPWRNGANAKLNRTRMDQAPKGSIWWWRAAGLDGEWASVKDEARAAVAAGIDLCVRLEQLSAVERTDLYRMIGG